MTVKDKMVKCFRHFICILIYELNWRWLELGISMLCDLEMGLKLILNKDFKDCNSPTTEDIPENSLYCGECPYRSFSKVAQSFYGEQVDGYCYYLGRGDYSFIQSTMLIWDGCKECGINDDCQDEQI